MGIIISIPCLCLCLYCFAHKIPFLKDHMDFINSIGIFTLICAIIICICLSWLIYEGVKLLA